MAVESKQYIGSFIYFDLCFTARCRDASGKCVLPSVTAVTRAPIDEVARK